MPLLHTVCLTNALDLPTSETIERSVSFPLNQTQAIQRGISNCKVLMLKLGWRYHPIHAGVGSEAGTLTLYRQDNGDNNEWELGLYPRSDRENVPVNITNVRFSSWLTAHVEDRVIPRRLSKNEKMPEPIVLMKIDVEGMEFDLFPDLFTRGSLCRNVDHAFSEIHPFKWYGGSRREIRQLQNTLNKWNASDDCKTKRIDQMDKEKYLMVLQPLPGGE